MVHFLHFFLLFLTALMSSVLFLFVPFFLLVQLLRSQFLSLFLLVSDYYESAYYLLFFVPLFFYLSYIYTFHLSQGYSPTYYFFIVLFFPFFSFCHNCPITIRLLNPFSSSFFYLIYHHFSSLFQCACFYSLGCLFFPLYCLFCLSIALSLSLSLFLSSLSSPLYLFLSRSILFFSSVFYVLFVDRRSLLLVPTAIDPINII